MSTTTLDTNAQLRLPEPARFAMAACAVLAPALLLVAGLLHPVAIGAEGRDAVQQFADNIDGYTVSSWLYPIATFLWIPALLTVGRIARSGAPALGVTGMVLAFGLAIPVALNADDLAAVSLDNGLDVATTTALIESAQNLPSGVLGFSWLAGLIGVLLLGVAILRGGSAPVWAGAALIVAPLAMPAAYFSGSAVVLVAAWVLQLVGFTGCAIAHVTRAER